MKYEKEWYECDRCGKLLKLMKKFLKVKSPSKQLMGCYDEEERKYDREGDKNDEKVICKCTNER